MGQSTLAPHTGPNWCPRTGEIAESLGGDLRPAPIGILKEFRGKRRPLKGKFGRSGAGGEVRWNSSRRVGRRRIFCRLCSMVRQLC